MRCFLNLFALLFPLTTYCRSTEEVRVRLFSKYRMNRVYLHLHGGGWRAGDRPLMQGEYIVEAGRRNVFLRDSRGRKGRGFLLRISSDGSMPFFSIRYGNLRRTYQGSVFFSVVNRELVVVNRLPLEAYAESVLFAEVPSLAGRRRIMDALRALAVAVRSYARYYLQEGKRRHGSDGYDFCDLTHCQVYRGTVPAGYRSLRRAVRETRGLVLRYRGRLVPGFHSSTCGGRTVSPGVVWGDRSLDRAFPGRVHRLHGRAPCRVSPHFRWSFSVRRDVFRTFFSHTCFPLLSVRELRLLRGEGGSLMSLSADRLTVPGYVFRNRFCKRWGWNSLRSLRFGMKVEGERVVFLGEGLGHCIGLCQHGAFALSAAGWGWRRILGEYYPALSVTR